MLQILKHIVNYLDERVSKTAAAQRKKFLAASEELDRLKRTGATSDKLAFAEKKVRELETGIYVGGPLDGRPVTREMLKLNMKYSIMSRIDDEHRVVVYERKKGTTTLTFLRSFEADGSYDRWSSENPQEFWDTTT